jgi:hypothetical protein
MMGWGPAELRFAPRALRTLEAQRLVLVAPSPECRVVAQATRDVSVCLPGVDLRPACVRGLGADLGLAYCDADGCDRDRPVMVELAAAATWSDRREHARRATGIDSQ